MDTWLEIDLNKLASNFNYMKEKTKTKIISVVKANAYGMGAVRISQELEKLGTDMFAVATYAEAEELRENGVTKEILIFNETNSENFKNSINKNYIFTIFNTYYLNKWIDDLGKDIEKLKFHVKVDTGMNRLGFKLANVREASEIFIKNKINVEGIYSHFAAAESDEKYTEYQFKQFEKLLTKFGKNRILFKCKHIANSAAGLKYNKYNLDFVRIGMSLYGLQPLIEPDGNIKEIFTWKSKVIEVKKIKIGDRISYSLKPSIKERTIAIIPVGYAQGYMRQLSGKGYVFIHNQKCEVIGNVCMEKLIIDITEIEGINIETEVILLGGDVCVEEKSKLAFTIGDDIISKIDCKIKRVYN